ncbi:MAG TPA: hypothetical protein VFP48_12170 [Steroidobacteraceae bacterium]|nr:hypothetical protein [Steroidobacteraceae bacterium]
MSGTGENGAQVAHQQGTAEGEGPDGAQVQVVREALGDLLDQAAVGSLLASAAHAGNNRLTVILSCLDLLGAAGIGDEDLRAAVGLATGAAQQLANEFSSLLEAAHRNAPPAQAVDLGEALRRVRILDRLLHGDTVALECVVAPGLEVDVERESLVAALLRLVVLARRRGVQSIRIGGGVFEVEARSADHPSLRRGRYCRLEFELAGVSWPQPLPRRTTDAGEVVDRLGDLDGLEYAAVEAFVAALRGQASTTSKPGVTRVVLYLPASIRDA